jgi:hypothetical protein
MLPNVDVFVGKHINWNDFQDNLDFFLKTFDIRYLNSGVYIKKRKDKPAPKRQ